MIRSLALLLALVTIGCAPAGRDAVPADGAGGSAAPDGALPEGAGGGGEGWLASPLDSPRVTSPVTLRRSGGGWQRGDCSAASRANHRGTDFGVGRGTPVHAAAAGTVIRSTDGCSNNGSMSSSCGGGFGNHVIIQHAGGYATLYAHLTRGTPVANGTRVECGEVIGASGNSGRSSGPHLHFEVRSGVSGVSSYYGSGRTIDPWGGACAGEVQPLWIGGTPSRSCTPAGPRDDASIVRASLPGEVRGTGGMRLTQTLTVRNTGTTTWDAAGYALVHTSGAFSEVDRVDLPSDVAPGRQVDLSIAVTVPDAAGTHRGQWRMAKIGAAIFGRTGTLAVRVAAAPRACNSATLGREVPDGECVQVSYPGCGSRTCAWFGCADGAWTCTDGSMCPGDAHAHDSCEPPAAPDAGMPVPVDGGMCEGEGQLCWADGDCCDGMACIAGACRDASMCQREATACGSGSDCCYPLQCQPSSIGGATTCCVSGGNRCDADEDCCGEMLCTGGHCAYRQRGESCANLLDCEGALLCQDDVCAI